MRSPSVQVVVTFRVDVVLLVLLRHAPGKSALGADINEMEVLVGDVIEGHHLLARAVDFCVLTLVNVSLRQSRIVNNVRVDDELLRLCFQILVIDAVVVLVALLGPIIPVANGALVDEHLLVRVLVRLQHVAAVLAEALALEFVDFHLIDY